MNQHRQWSFTYARRALKHGFLYTIAVFYTASLSVSAAELELNLGGIYENSNSFNLDIDAGFSELVEADTILIRSNSGVSTSLMVTAAKTVDGLQSIRAMSNDGDALTLSRGSTASYGTLNLQDEQYYITGGPNNTSLQFSKQNAQTRPIIDLSHDMRIPPNKRADKPGIEQMSQANQRKLAQLSERSAKAGKSIIRMLFLYSPEFGDGFASPQTRITQLLNYTNSALERSNIEIEFTLAHARQVGFDNSKSTGDLLDDATFARGPFANVEELRDEFAADMVAVLSFNEGNSANGIAWVNGDDPDFAFSSTRLSTRCCDSVFAHELGHNLGSGHERESVNNRSDPCDRFNFTGYSCGHGNQNNPSGSWGTMMSRLNSSRVDDVFSNPALDCLGEPCGIADGSANAADNFASFNMSRLLVADFRPDPVQVIPDPGPTPPSGPRPPFRKSVMPPIIGLLLDDWFE